METSNEPGQPADSTAPAIDAPSLMGDTLTAAAQPGSEKRVTG